MGMNHFKKRRCFVQAASVWVSSVRCLSVRLSKPRSSVWQRSRWSWDM